MVMLLADRFSRISAPAKAWAVLGGVGVQTSSQIDLDAHRERGDALAPEQNVGPERNGLAGQGQGLACQAGARREPATLVELAIVGQEAFRDHAQHLAALDDDRGIVEAACVAQRTSDHDHRRQACAGLGQGGDRGLNRVQQRLLLQKVVDRVARQPQFREHDHSHALRMGLAGQSHDVLSIGGGIRQLDLRNGGRDPDETVTVGREERRTTQGSGLSGLC